jgi:prophage DNA circulation protein
MTWSSGDLKTASFRGLSFDVISTEDDFSRRITEHKFPYRDGALLEDTGREPKPTNITAVFFGEDYLSRLTAFLALVDEGTTGPFQHPLLGRWQAKVFRVAVRHSHDRRDSAEVELELKEDGTDTTVQQISGADAAAGQLDDDVTAAQDAYDDLDQTVDSAQDAIDDAGDFGADADDQIDDLTERADQLDRNVQDAISDLDALDDQIAASPVVDALRDAHLSALRLKTSLEHVAPLVVSRDVGIDTPLTLLALTELGDPDRLDDILRLNKIRNPAFVEPGIVLKIPSK